jgi:hypothetical protein
LKKPKRWPKKLALARKNFRHEVQKGTITLAIHWLGEVYAESGRREEALVHLKKAEGMFAEMGMDYWLARSRGALARL